MFFLKGHTYRPFVEKFKVYCRSYSRPLQRAVTDFGSDGSFAEASNKMQEHYGLELPACSIQKITEKHGRQIAKWEPATDLEAAYLLIAEIDGTMVPIVEVGEKREGIDLRKTRKILWKEAKLCFARPQGKVSRTYAAVIGSAEEAGKQLYACAKQCGLVEKTDVHALGDGAQWIAGQVEEQFGQQARFFVDFFHMCEYLSDASVWCDPLNPKSWFKKKKEEMKEGKAESVLRELQAKVSEVEKTGEENGLVKCVRYMEKRIQYMCYAEAIAKDLPIGSGEIESSHRHVIQKRLKIPGAWWKLETANAMLQLRTARANGYWKAYWEKRKVA